MNEESKIILNVLMEAMPVSWRYRWCEGEMCACLGAANCSGQISKFYSKEEWVEWVENHPPFHDASAKNFISEDGKYDFEGHRKFMYGQATVTFVGLKI